MTHRFDLRVYYEDTDVGGVVYYANYLRFIERARSEMIRALGIDQVALANEGVAFVVRRIEAEYLLPAKFDDCLAVETTVLRTTPARAVLRQRVVRDKAMLFEAEVTLAAVSDGRPVRLPAALRLLD
ncbi:MAG: tol-pal system-associated acyl-CoA thioesterase [Pseudomonadota bacterium]